MAVNAAPGDDFKQKLVLSIVDKLVFGLLIVLAGFVLNLVLENHRADQAMKTEIARVRVDKVAEVWQALDRHMRAVESVGRSEVTEAFQTTSALGRNPGTLEGLFGPEAEASTDKRWASLQEEEARLKALLDTNRFWIGERLFPKYRDYASGQSKLLSAYFRLSIQLMAEGMKLSRPEVSDPTPDMRLNAEDVAALTSVRTRGMEHIEQLKREVSKSRTDVFSAMEQLS